MNKAAISILNSLLIDEIAAAESYKQALQKLPKLDIRLELKEQQNSHEQRVRRLTKRVKELGGEPVEKTNKRVLLDYNLPDEQLESVVLDAFEDLEHHSLKLYQSSIADLDEESRELILATILPDQELTHNVVFTLGSGDKRLAKSA
jgi:hypothetical protein